MAGKPNSDPKKDKRAAALRDNLKKRKAFVKGRKTTDKDNKSKE